MKQSMIITLVLIGGLLVGGTVFALYKALAPAANIAQVPQEETPTEVVEALDPTISVGVIRSKVKDNTVVLSVIGLGGKVRSIAYELSYTSQGIVQGVTTKPVDVTGKDTFVRDDIYLGTCSKNVCRPHTGVKSVSVVLEFTNVSGGKSQFSKEYDF
ncbi:hypothetical protein HY949_00680 [Candidatus Gottesmanbacteria bacterium]|nr:hypothetical protein [Candidatus Gottesmanbacteria bacterium]